MERVYISDWLYNAGIVGFLKVLGGREIEGEKLLDESKREIEGVRIGDNYVEFEREAVKGYTDKFLKEAADRHYRFYIKPYFKNISPGSAPPDLESAKKLREKLQNFVKRLELEVEIPKITKKELEERVGELLSKFEEIEGYLREIPEKEIYNFAKSWLTKGFYDSNLTRKLYNKKNQEKDKEREKTKTLIRQKVEEPVLNPPQPFTVGRGRKKAEVPCTVCFERVARDGINYSTTLSSFAGFNKDNINFIYLYTKNRQLPICEICNLILFSAPIGLIPVGNYYDNRFIFINNSSSVKELFEDNIRLENILSREKDNFLVEFFTEKVVLAHEETSPLTLSGISVIELEAQKPRVRNFNVSYEKAKFLTDEKLIDKLKSLKKASFRLKGSRETKTYNLLEEAVNQLLTDSISFSFVYRLLRYYLRSSQQRGDVEVYFNPFHVFNLITVYFKYLELFGGGSMKDLEERELWYAWNRGLELRELFKRAGQENKVDSIAFKLLNALRTSNFPRFMDILLRIYAGFSKEAPSFLVKGAQNPELFQILGYSFVTGFLGERKNQSEREEE